MSENRPERRSASAGPPARLYGSPAADDVQRAAFRAGEVAVAVYGLGKMGLPLAAVYADVCGNVTGVDVDEDVVESVGAGDCHVEGEPDLPELVECVVDRGALSATTDGVAAAAAASVHVLMVPTLLDDDNDPDLSLLDAATDTVAEGLSPGDLVIVESTVPPRTCRDRVLPRLTEASGLDRGEFGLAFCPERTSSGRAVRDVRGAHPKVVGGVDDESARVAELVYGELTDNDVFVVSDATTAEAVKVFEGVYRDVNIALANELARLADALGTDVTEAIRIANTQPYCDIHDPGPGVGGHCIPYYPYFLIRPFDAETILLPTARLVNDSMPGFVVERLAEGLEAAGEDVEGATVLVLGLTYRAGVAETRAAPARRVCRYLDGLGADVLAVDPMLDAGDVADFDATLVDLADVYAQDVDAAALVTAHAAFDDLDWNALDPTVVVDGRRTLDLDGADRRVYAVGEGWVGGGGDSP